jgi:hypothetical protein
MDEQVEVKKSIFEQYHEEIHKHINDCRRIKRKTEGVEDRIIRKQ